MNRNVFGVITFLAGAAIGSIVTWKFAKTKYEKIANEEIESVKEVFSKRKENTEKAEVKEYHTQIKDSGYDTAIDIEKTEKGEEMSMNDKVYIIPPEEFDETGYYETVSLTYYADDVLADEMNFPIVDMDVIGGEDTLTHFGEYEDDSIFVRNDELKIDFEILRDERNYTDVYRVNDIRDEE